MIMGDFGDRQATRRGANRESSQREPSVINRREGAGSGDETPPTVIFQPGTSKGTLYVALYKYTCCFLLAVWWSALSLPPRFVSDCWLVVCHDPCSCLESNGADARVDVALRLRAHGNDAAALSEGRLQPVELRVTFFLGGGKCRRRWRQFGG